MTERTPEMDQHDFDLRGRVVNLEHGATNISNRLTALELWKYQSDIADARREEQLKGIEKSLTTIQGILSRINWILIGGILLAIVGFMVRGGLSSP